MSEQENNTHLDLSIEIDPETFRRMVEECAYYKAERRGFSSGHEMDDWLEAEQEIYHQHYRALADNDSS